MFFHISCASGLESILKKEVEIQGYKVTNKKPNLIGFEGDLLAIAKLNLRTRVGNKVYIQLGKANAETFDQLFDLANNIDRSYYIKNDSPITVTASSRNSTLHSIPAIQSIGKKAIVKKLLKGQEGKLTENPELTPIEINLHIEDNECLVLLNTSGKSLHRRGYRKATGEAPINESLAAGLIFLSGRRFSEALYDPCCGSGTIAIEAALIAKNIAPGLLRTFSFQDFDRYDQTLFTKEKKSAQSKIMKDKEHTIIATDIDEDMIKMAQLNAKNAGVDKFIQWETKNLKAYIKEPELKGALVCNPPYGLRMQTFDLEILYNTIANIFKNNPQLNGGIITSYENFDNKNFKKITFYNGGEKCRFFKRKLF